MQTRRDRQIQILPEYHLIVSEGEKTEPNYFEGLRKEINRIGKGRIKIRIEGEGDNTLYLLERAQAYVLRDKNPIRHVWLVYDLDSFPSDNFDNTYHKCIALSQPPSLVSYHALWSNQCIELWFLLHFAYHQEDIHRAGYKPILDKYLNKLHSGKYRKNRDDIYDILRPLRITAMNNAKRLKTLHNVPIPSKNAPGTSVYEIFDFFAAYLQ